jgi:hypothetical protein
MIYLDLEGNLKELAEMEVALLDSADRASMANSLLELIKILRNQEKRILALETTLINHGVRL